MPITDEQSMCSLQDNRRVLERKFSVRRTEPCSEGVDRIAEFRLEGCSAHSDGLHRRRCFHDNSVHGILHTPDCNQQEGSGQISRKSQKCTDPRSGFISQGDLIQRPCPKGCFRFCEVSSVLIFLPEILSAVSHLSRPQKLNAALPPSLL